MPLQDRDPLFTTEFLTMLADVGVKSVKLPPLAESECARRRREIRPQHQGIVPGPDAAVR